MNIARDMENSMYMPVVGCKGTELGECFENMIKKYGLCNIHFICSLAYSLGKMHGIREERDKRKKKAALNT